MIQISYLSKTSSPMSAAQLVSLLQQCHANNTARGVTGMLFYGNGTFLQVIEGGRDEVCDLFNAIVRDDRHNHVRLLSECKLGDGLYVEAQLLPSDGKKLHSFFWLRRASDDAFELHPVFQHPTGRRDPPAFHRDFAA